MADMSRASSFLPTIKCSSCAQDIQISLMGEHICGPSAGEPTPPPDTYGNFDRMPYGKSEPTSQSYLRAGKAMPPRVDISAANRPFVLQDQLTPVSASPTRSASPMTPQSFYDQPQRSATAPLQRAPASPELLSPNLDSAFPPFPTAKVTAQRRVQEAGYSTNRLYAEPDPMYAPVSPRMGVSQGVLQRMNTIAPGPFDVNKRPRPGARMPAPSTTPGHQRAGSLKVSTMSTRTADIGPNLTRPTKGSHNRSSTSSSNDSIPGIAAPRMPRTNGYGGFGPPPAEESVQSSENRSQTYPVPRESREPLRRPSELANTPGIRDRIGDSRLSDGSLSPKSSPSRRRRPSNNGPDLSRPPPPRSNSLIRPRTADNRPNLEVNLADEFGIGNPYHTPTESQSSSGSGYSDASKVSSRSSPPRPSTSQSRRKPSNIDQVTNLMSDLQSSMGDIQPKEKFSGNPFNRRAPPPSLGPVPRYGALLQSPESPMDPAMKSGSLSPLPQRSPTQQLPPLEDSRNRSPARRPSRPTTAKGNCKSCGEAIKGKSISSADGRLTGRYHKGCFNCNTCLEPFQTATFYVLDDMPYCERHYHKLNGSVCNTCDKGIEGQYLESESKQKFHPQCLTCSDCRRNLRNDYFEMNGRVYCERDAFRRAQQGRNLGVPSAGTNRMERRTTRLMMM